MKREESMPPSVPVPPMPNRPLTRRLQVCAGCAQWAQKGSAALVVVLLLATIGLTLTLNRSMSSKTELKIAHNDLLGKQALAAAEAGLRHAAKLIGDDAVDGLNDELENDGTGGAGSGMEDFGEVTPEVCPADVGGKFRFKAFGGESDDGYCVQVQDNFDETTAPNDRNSDVDGHVKLIAIGIKATARRRVEAMFNPDPDCALLTRSRLNIVGDPNVNGRKGCTHSNGDTAIPGDPVLEKGATASGTMNISGHPTLEGTTPDPTSYATDHQNQAAKSIPSVRPFSFGAGNVNLAAEVAAVNGYRLASDGNVYQGGTWDCTVNPCTYSGTPLTTLPLGWGWTYTSDSDSNPAAKWDYSGGGPLDGAFFVEGWVTISSSPSSGHATIIALNSIQVSGNPSLAPFTTAPTHPLRNLLFVSGNDVELSGNPNLNGAIFAHQQFKLSGSAILNGFIIAEDGQSNWTLAPDCTSDKDLICDPNGSLVSGNPIITYDGLSTVGFGDTIELVDWHETGE